MELLVEWLWQGLLVALVTTIAIQVVPKRAAAVRHAIWWLAMILVFALPLAATIERALPHAAMALSAASSAPTSAPLVLPPPPSWLPTALLAAWMLSVVVAMVRLMVSTFVLRRIVRQAVPLDVARAARLDVWNRARAGRQIALKVSTGIRGACAVGFGTPTLLVSSNLADALDDQQLQAILLHELAHLERRDDWTGLVQRVCVALGGLHLAVRWISRQIDVEREAACDQRVVSRTGAPVTYARSLAEAAAASLRGRGLTPHLAPGSSTTRSMLKVRVERLLHAPVPHLRRVWTAAAGTVTAIGSAVIVAVQAPMLVSFAALPAAIIAAPDAWIAQLLPAESPRHVPAVAESAPRARVQPVAAVAPVDAQRAMQAMPVVAAEPAATTDVPTSMLPVAAVESAAEPVAPVESVAPSAPAPVAPAVPAGSTSVASATASHQAPALPAMPIAASAGQPASSNVFATLGGRFASMGAAVADASVATGQGAGRAGSSVGRFFKERGLAVARSF